MDEKDKKPCVSIIVPVYKVEKYLERCLNTIRNQTLENLEVILVDDGSPDRCPGICDDAAKEDARIRVIHKENEGPGLARNTGLEAARGEYIYFVDSDDYLEKTAVEILYCAAKDKNLDICLAGITLITGEKQTKKVPKYAGRIFTQPQIVGMVLTDMLGTAPEEKVDCTVRMSVWQGIYRRSWLEQNGIRFVSNGIYLSEDILFHLDCLPLAGRLGYLEECIYCHVEDNAASWTHRYHKDYLKRHGLQYLEELRRTEQFENAAQMRRRIQRTYIGNARVCLQQLVGARDSMERQEFKRELKELVGDPVLQEVLREFPYRRTPWKQRTLSFFLRYRREKIVYFLIWLFLKVGRRSR